MTGLTDELHNVRNKFAADTPEEIGHIRVGAINSTKARQQGHQSDSDHTYTADELFDWQDPWTE